MKTLKKYFKVLIILINVLQICSCTEDAKIDTPSDSTGQAMFWLASDIGVGSITVSCNGSSKTFNNYYASGAPSCGASGAANFTLNPGTYSYSASAGAVTWNGNIIVTTGGCSKMQLTYSGTGGSGSGTGTGGTNTGQAMFWIASDLGVGTISVSCNGSTKTVNSYSSGAPSCGATGAANFTLNPGTYSYSASAGAVTWSGNITVTTGGCSKLQLAYSGSGGGTGGTLTLNGKWQGSDGRTFTISGSSGVFNSFGTGNWSSAANKGFVKVGDLFLRNISNVNSTTWNAQPLWVYGTNGIVVGVKWGTNGTIIISSNGNSFTLTASDGGSSQSATFTRIN